MGRVLEVRVYQPPPPSVHPCGEQLMPGTACSECKNPDQCDEEEEGQEIERRQMHVFYYGVDEITIESDALHDKILEYEHRKRG